MSVLRTPAAPAARRLSGLPLCSVSALNNGLYAYVALCRTSCVVACAVDRCTNDVLYDYGIATKQKVTLGE